MGAGREPLTLAERFATARALTEGLAAPLSDADATAQSMPDASPAKWHLAHTTWFWEQFVLLPAGHAPYDPRFGYLFNSYYDALGDRHPRPHRGLLTRPSLAEVLAWRAHVTTAVLTALDQADPALLELGLAHEAQHAELLQTDILHLFAQNPLAPAMWPVREVHHRPALPLIWIEHGGGPVEVGAPAGTFAFDAERPRHPVLLRPFALAGRTVTNAEWQAFIDDGGYRTPAHWLSDGWAWVARERIDAPLYWRDGTTMTLEGRLPLDPEAPVTHVSHYEADAYAAWAGARLPTEFEWEVLAQAHDPHTGGMIDGPGPVAPQPGTPRNAPSLFGDVWEWTASAFLPYPGFARAPGAVGEYTAKFMSGQIVLRGGSCATPRGSVYAHTRNYFPPHARWQFSGVRLARDA